MHYNRFYRNTDAGGQGGTEPSLSDLDATDDNGFNEPTLTAEEIAAKAAAQDGIAGAPKITELDANEPKPGDKPADPGDAAQRLPETEEEKTAREAEEAAAAAATAGTGDGDGEDEPQDFYAAVDTLRGDNISEKIKYPEGVDPTSPAGVLVREKFLEEHGAMSFEAELKANDPRGYAYLLHRQNGGDDETFFAKPSFALPDLDALKDSVDLQRQVLTQSLLSKGNTPKQAQTLVDLAAKEGELPADAEAAYNEMKKREDDEFTRINQETEARKQKQVTEINSFTTLMSTEVEKGENLKFIIPEADKPKFLQSVRDNMMYEDGKFYVVKPVTQDNLSEVLQTELFAYLKGDIKKLVERQAKTITAQKLTLKAAGKATPKNVHTSSGTPTLGDL